MMARWHNQSQYAFAQYLAGAKTDLEGLKAFDTNHNGQLDSGDTVWKDMKVWQDLNGNGVSDAGEVKTLSQIGVTSINLTSDGVASDPANGVHEAGKASATMADSSQITVADVSFDTKDTASETGVVAHPFVLDMNHDGMISYGKSLMDVNGTGVKQLVAWAGKEDGILVWDQNQNGQILNSSQYSFGTSSSDKDSLQGLKLFDSNDDGKLDNHDVLWKQLSVWQDANGNGESDTGEVKTLTELGFESIRLQSDGNVTKPAEGVIEAGKLSASMHDNSTMVIADAAVTYVSTDALHPLSYLAQNHNVI